MSFIPSSPPGNEGPTGSLSHRSSPPSLTLASSSPGVPTPSTSGLLSRHYDYHQHSAEVASAAGSVYFRSPSDRKRAVASGIETRFLVSPSHLGTKPDNKTRLPLKRSLADPFEEVRATSPSTRIKRARLGLSSNLDFNASSSCPTNTNRLTACSTAIRLVVRNGRAVIARDESVPSRAVLDAYASDSDDDSAVGFVYDRITGNVLASTSPDAADQFGNGDAAKDATTAFLRTIARSRVNKGHSSGQGLGLTLGIDSSRSEQAPRTPLPRIPRTPLSSASTHIDAGLVPFTPSRHMPGLTFTPPGHVVDDMFMAFTTGMTPYLHRG